jgi:hypothetical protein
MSWASKRRAEYLFGVILFFAVLIGVPTAILLYHAPTCNDGKQNQDETDVDKGGSCPLVDERMLTPHATLFARAFKVRQGVYTAVAYVENPNVNAGVVAAPYRFALYDINNVLVAERTGIMSVLPGAITPVFEGSIPTGNRDISRAFFEFTDPLVWERLTNPISQIVTHEIEPLDIDTNPRVTALVKNDAVTDIRNLKVVAVVFDTQGNAFASSGTVIPLVPGGQETPVTFTWPEPFKYRIAKIDVLPIVSLSR